MRVRHPGPSRPFLAMADPPPAIMAEDFEGIAMPFAGREHNLDLFWIVDHDRLDPDDVFKPHHLAWLAGDGCPLHGRAHQFQMRHTRQDDPPLLGVIGEEKFPSAEAGAKSRAIGLGAVRLQQRMLFCRRAATGTGSVTAGRQ